VAEEGSSCFSLRIVGGINQIDALTSQEVASKMFVQTSHFIGLAIGEPPTAACSTVVQFFPGTCGSPPEAKIFLRIGTLLI